MAAFSPLAEVFRVRSCCSTALGSHTAALLVGDSLVGDLFSSLCLTQADLATNCSATVLLHVPVAGKDAPTSLFPGYYTAARLLPAVERHLRTSRLTPRLTFVLSDYAAVHLLHMHPVLTWFDSLQPMSEQILQCHNNHALPRSCPDWLGWRHLEAWISSDVRHYRAKLPASVQLVLMTPYTICEERFSGPWLRWLQDSEVQRLANCTAWVLEHEKARTELAALDECNRSQFTAVGTRSVASRMRTVAKAHQLDLVDGETMAELTPERCNATIDGVHYSSLNREAAHEVRRISLLWTGAGGG